VSELESDIASALIFGLISAATLPLGSAHSPLRRRLSGYRRRNRLVSDLIRQHRLDASRAAQWSDNAINNIAGGKAFPRCRR